MPDTQAWNAFLTKGRDRPPFSTAALDQAHAAIEGYARQLGFTLDRNTVEAAIMGATVAYYLLGAVGRGVDATDDDLLVFVALAHWLLVERLDGMEGT